MICAESEVLERHLDFLTGKSLLLTGAVNDEFLSDLRRQGFNARAWSWYFDYANRENQKQQSAVDFLAENDKDYNDGQSRFCEYRRSPQAYFRQNVRRYDFRRQ